MIVTVIGRGHSGTRAIAETLIASGVYMGTVNKTADMVPPGAMYAAARMVGALAWWDGGTDWDFTEIHDTEPLDRFHYLVGQYLEPLHENPQEKMGWKLPETLLALPWLLELFPDIHYIYWVRNPLDVMLGGHVTDDLRRWGVQCWLSADLWANRAASWKYQYDLVKSTPKPDHWLQVRFEDYVLRQEETLGKLEDFLGMNLVRLPVNYDAVGRYKKVVARRPDFLEASMREMGYWK